MERKMKNASLIILMLFSLLPVKAQKADTFYLHIPASKKDTTIYKRIIQVDTDSRLFHVRDYYPNGQIQMDGNYSSFDRNIKEESLWCNYRTNTKVGEFIVWYNNGQIESKTNYKNGLRDGLLEYWYPDGKKESSEIHLNGQLNGISTYWDSSGRLENEYTFNHGVNQKPKDVNYKYISYTPEGFNDDKTKTWPLIIYLHGGSSRGTDTTKLFCCGIPDQIWRGRKFPFIVVAPQCPLHLRWSTDNWFENFYKEITTKYRIDTNRVYLTGVSLGGSGTWYIATKYPEKFAAIAPISGFTRDNDYIINNTDNLINIPIWAFHGKSDKVVHFEDTEWIVNELVGKNKDLKFTAEPEVGHWVDWLVYPGQDLYDWFLKHNKN